MYVTLQLVCDAIILIGAVVLAISRIASFFGKPFSILTKHREKVETERLEKLLEILIPKYLETYGDTKFSQFADDVKNSIIEELGERFSLIENTNMEQNEQLAAISVGMMNILRQRIMDIYEKGEKTRTITRKDKEILDELYKDYTSLHGNSYITKYYNRIRKDWKVIPDIYDA